MLLTGAPLLNSGLMSLVAAAGCPSPAKRLSAWRAQPCLIFTLLTFHAQADMKLDVDSIVVG